MAHAMELEKQMSYELPCNPRGGPCLVAWTGSWQAWSHHEKLSLRSTSYIAVAWVGSPQVYVFILEVVHQ